MLCLYIHKKDPYKILEKPQKFCVGRFIYLQMMFAF